MLRVFRSELINAILLGGVAVTLVAIFSGYDGLIIFLKSLIPPDEVVYYYALTLLTYIVVLEFCVRYAESFPRFVRRARDILKYLEPFGLSLMGVYRIIAGGLLVVSLPPIFIEFGVASLTMFFVSVFISGVSLALIAGFNYRYLPLFTAIR